MKKLTRGKGRPRMMTGDSYRKANAEASVAASEETERFWVSRDSKGW